MKFLVFYVERCTPKVKAFKTKAAAVRFAERHEKKNTSLSSDDWVDAILCGKLVRDYSGWFGGIK